MTTDHPKLWQLISAAFPVGSFHYSQGLERAVEAGWVYDAQSARDWIENGLRQLAAVDLPIIQRVWSAWNDRDDVKVTQYDELCRACRETAELRAADTAMGSALRRLADTFEEPVPAPPTGYVTLFAAVAANRGIPARLAMMGFAWAWCENQVLASVKLVPLGHLEGQHILGGLIECLNSMVDAAQALTDEQIGMTLPGLALAGMQHETMKTRLFRS